MARPPPNLPDLVKNAFTQALASHHLHHHATQVAILPVLSTKFQLRFAPSLAHKPSTSSHPPSDPFIYPSPSPLFIAPLPPSHFLILNKFAINRHHFIIATTEPKPQTHVLEHADVAATIACIAAYDGDVFAFFNAGPHSGASQPHRHIQLLPLDGLRDGVDDWTVLVDAGDDVPFLVFKEGIRGLGPDEVFAAYLRLYERACRAVGVQGDVPAMGDIMISYNMAVTADTLALCPRVKEGAAVRDGHGKEVGRLALNGTVLAGTALVKHEAEWEALKSDPEALHHVLRQIGLSPEQKK